MQVENYTVSNNRALFIQWSKAVFYVMLLMAFMMVAHATDQTGISQLDDSASKFQKGVQVFAKWGGILMIVIAGVVFGSGQAQGQTAKLLFGIVLAVGCIMGAWGWFSANFSYGFAF
jgi:hypothetical protein